MNTIRSSKNGITLNINEIKNAFNEVYSNPTFKTNFTDEEMHDRIIGNHCDCNGNGDFVLLDANDQACQEGGKRYMICQKCGGSSHL